MVVLNTPTVWGHSTSVSGEGNKEEAVGRDGRACGLMTGWEMRPLGARTTVSLLYIPTASQHTLLLLLLADCKSTKSKRLPVSDMFIV